MNMTFDSQQMGSPKWARRTHSIQIQESSLPWELNETTIALSNRPILGSIEGLDLRLSKHPSSGYLCIPKVRRNLLSGDAVRVKLPIPSRGRFLRLYRLGKGQKVENAGMTELIRKLPEPWRCSLSETEPKLSRP
jgi:hypothetical protein